MFLQTLLFLVFLLSSILLIVVILLQEGRGGGLGDAFGGAGQQTFGVGARGITLFTAAVAIVFIMSAIGIHVVSKSQSASVLGDGDPGVQAPVGAGALPEER
jgi:preprotein translocase subunit SecG